MCTVGETCIAGACGAGLPLDCDDQNPCTFDYCDSEIGCVHDAQGAEGAECDDGNLCTVGETCTDGFCGAGLPLDCNDQNVCTVDSCDALIGCVSDAQAAEGFPCEDGDFCTIDDTCIAGFCGPGLPISCDDGNMCTLDSCESETGACTHDALGANGMFCEDGDFCTLEDSCLGGFCSPGTPIDCDDQNVCTNDGCDPATGECFNDASGTDGTPCEGGGTCQGGICLPPGE
jgi:hypothetical protein